MDPASDFVRFALLALRDRLASFSVDYASFVAEPQRVVDASPVELLLLEKHNKLDTDADFELASATYRALEQLGVADCESALLEVFDPPAAFDVASFNEFDAPCVVIHPEHGMGLILDGVRAQSIRVQFISGERTLAGEEGQWTSAGDMYLCEASRLISTTPMAEDAFWKTVAIIEWGTPRPLDDFADALAKKLSFVESFAFQGAMYCAASRLERAIQVWEESSGKTLWCGDDRFGDLINHVIGLGREEYEAALSDPLRAFERSRTGDYRESFAYVAIVAREKYPTADIVRALRDFAPERLVDDAILGTGIRTSGKVFYPHCVVRE